VKGGGPLSWWLAARMACWVAVLPAALKTFPVARVVRLVEPTRRASRAHVRDCERVVALAQRATAVLSRHPETRCLVRSLVVYRFLLRAGFAPELRVGFERTEAGLRGHAWVLVAGVAVTDSAAQLAALTPAMTFVPEGLRAR
jgi:hypothetical protein